MQEKFDKIMRGRHFKKIMRQMNEPIRKKYNLKQVELEVLYFIATYSGLAAMNVCMELFLNKAQVSRAIDVLEKRGLVTASIKQNDKRSVTYEATEAAGPIVFAVDVNKHYIESGLLRGFTLAEFETFKDFVERIDKNMERMLKEAETQHQLSDTIQLKNQLNTRGPNVKNISSRNVEKINKIVKDEEKINV